MSLPNAWIDKIFERLALTYGRDFLGRWEGIDLDAVKDDWADKLAGFEHFGGGAIAYALDHLPERAPTVIEFAAIARKGPFKTGAAALPAPENKPRGPNDIERATMRRLAVDIRAGTLFAKPGRGWAYDLLQCHSAGWRNGAKWKATPVALDMARDAIASDVNRPADWVDPTAAPAADNWGTA